MYRSILIKCIKRNEVQSTNTMIGLSKELKCHHQIQNMAFFLILIKLDLLSLTLGAIFLYSDEKN